MSSMIKNKRRRDHDKDKNVTPSSKSNKMKKVESDSKGDLSSAFRSIFKGKDKKKINTNHQKIKKHAEQHNHEKVGINQLMLKKTNSSSQDYSKDNTSIFNSSKLSQLQQKFQKKLEGARFRAINEKLYSSNGQEAYSDFQSDPSLFEVYHEGFREQVKSWPINPLDLIIKWIKISHPNKIIADMGCGDAVLSISVPNKVYSFDLVSTTDRVIACDISNVPLKNESVDIVIFCLSLMGTNIGEFLREAHRILKSGGIIKIAEVRSRFEGEKEGIKKFIRTLKKAGFDCTEKNFENKMFFMLECKKSSQSCSIDPNYTAKVCMYKKR